MRSARLAIGLLALAGCGGGDVLLGDGRDSGAARPALDSGSLDSGALDSGPRDSGARDAGRDAATSRDASLPLVPVFMEPRAITAISGDESSDDDPSLSRDRLLLFFNSKRDGGLGREDIWFSQRATAGDEWQAPVAVPELNSDARETGIALAGDALTLYWSSDREGGPGGLDVYRARRSGRDQPWSAPELVEAVSSVGDDLVSALSSDGGTMMLARRDDEDDDYALYRALRDADSGEFTAPAPLSELDSEGDEETDGFLLGSGLQLIFSRDSNLWLTERASATEPFGPGAELESLNSDEDDRDAWASDALDYVVFSSDRSGSYLLYEATR